jgi:ferredoxin-NADP reductase
MAGTRSLSHAARVPDDALDSLLNEIESDLNVEDAVRQAHAAVHGNAGGDIGCDAILQAIEDAERHLMLNPPAPVETALDDELLDKPRQRNKAA